MPPPRIHRHRHFGVLAPNSPLRAALTALAPAAAPTPPVPPPEPPNDDPTHRRVARYAWAALLARIYEVVPVVCPRCGADMRIIAFITDASTIRDILVDLGEPTAPPRIAPARGPPLWEAADPEHDPADISNDRGIRDIGRANLYWVLARLAAGASILICGGEMWRILHLAGGRSSHSSSSCSSGWVIGVRGAARGWHIIRPRLN